MSALHKYIELHITTQQQQETRRDPSKPFTPSYNYVAADVPRFIIIARRVVVCSEKSDERHSPVQKLISSHAKSQRQKKNTERRVNLYVWRSQVYETNGDSFQGHASNVDLCYTHIWT